MKAYNRLDRRFRRDVSCSTCIKTGLHIVYKRKDDGEHMGDYGKYLTEFGLFTSLSLQVIFTCKHYSLRHADVKHQKSRIIYQTSSPSELYDGLNVSWVIMH